MKHEVIVEKVAGLRPPAARETILERIRSRGWFDGLKKHVVIKPNLCVAASPSSGIVTDTLLVEDLIRLLREGNDERTITLVETDAQDKVAKYRPAESVFERLGYCELRDKYGVALHNLSRDPVYPVLLPDLPCPLNVSEFFLDSDFSFISLAQLKVHNYEKITCTLKNHFGLVPDVDKGRKFHPYLNQVLYYMARIAAAECCIIDGRVGMAEAGPIDGKPKKVDVFIAGRDPGAVDTVCARIMGFEPAKVPHLRHYCRLAGVAEGDIDVQGEAPAEDFRFGPLWRYRTIRGKLAWTRLMARINYRVKRGIRIFFLPPRAKIGGAGRKLKRFAGALLGACVGPRGAVTE